MSLIALDRPFPRRHAGPNPTQVGDAELPAHPAVSRRQRRARPAAIAWQGTTVPLIGRLRADAFLVAVVLAAGLVALCYLLQTSGVATTGYDIQRLEQDKSEWELRNGQLRLELDKLQSLAWVESEAVGRLGMVRPDKYVYLQSAGEGQ